MDEPEAVIVEVEDDGLELLPLSTETTPLQIQIPVFKFDFANKDTKYGFLRKFNLHFLKFNFYIFLTRHDLKMDVSKTFAEIKNSLNNIENYLQKHSKSLERENLRVRDFL